MKIYYFHKRLTKKQFAKEYTTVNFNQGASFRQSEISHFIHERVTSYFYVSLWFLTLSLLIGSMSLL